MRASQLAEQRKLGEFHLAGGSLLSLHRAVAVYLWASERNKMPPRRNTDTANNGAWVCLFDLVNLVVKTAFYSRLYC